jgi:membrane protease YdiL (CAAX protease family)
MRNWNSNVANFLIHFTGMTLQGTIRKHPVASYFGFTFIISWGSAYAMVAPSLLRGEAIPKMTGLLLFPVMIVGPCVAAFVVSYFTEGKQGVQAILRRMRRWNVALKWYVQGILIPPVFILVTLFLLTTIVSTDFKPNFFPIGFLFAIPAGLLEEIGWSGFAFQQLHRRYHFMTSGIIIGLLWGLWHFPVIDFLGAASPHKQYLLFFFFAFVAVMVGIRLLISWLYLNTHSIFLCQVTHIASTGCLVMFGPSRVSAAEECVWYSVYAIFLLIGLLSFFYSHRSRVDMNF